MQSQPGYKPFELNTGMNPSDPRNVRLEDLVWHNNGTDSNEEMLSEWETKLRKAHTIYCEGLKLAAADADRFRRAPDFKVGDQVMLKTKYLSWPGVDMLGKHLKPPNIGPFTVTAMDKRNVTIDWNKPGVRVHPVQPLNRVFKYSADTSEYGKSKSQPRRPPPVPTRKGDEYEIEKILDRRLRRYGRGQRHKYQVAWKGYASWWNQWLPESELIDGAERTLKAYNRKYPKPIDV